MSEKKTVSDEQRLSRRDFLRRAGREAVDTGAKIVPGASLARAAIDKTGQEGLLQRLISWRGKRAPAPDTPKEENHEADA